MKNKYNNKQQQPRRRHALLLEQEADQAGAVVAVDPSATEQPQNVSLDQKVDRFFIQYEREATGAEEGTTAALPTKPAISIAERRRRSSPSLYSMLFEQEEDPTAAAGDPAADAGLGDAGGGDDLAGGDAGAPTEEGPPPVPVPNINVNIFASRLARLVGNYNALLDPRTTILRRAQTYLAKNYSEKVGKELMTVMETQYNMSIKTKAQSQDELPPAPMAVGAGMEGGGGGGGG